MKRIFLIITSFILLNQITAIAQEITVSSTFSHSSYNKFQNNIGYEIAYIYPIKLKSRLGFSFSQSFNNTDYNYIFASNADGEVYYREVKPKNQRFVFSVEYTFAILNKENSSFFIGQRFGLNYFKISEFVVERPVNENENYDYNSNYRENHKIGIGLLFEYERKVFSDNISVFFSTEPEVIFFSGFGLLGSSDPVMIGLINFNLGFKFNIKKNREVEHNK